LLSIKWTDAPEGLFSAISSKSCLARELGCSTPEFPRCIQAFSADAFSKTNFSYPEYSRINHRAHREQACSQARKKVGSERFSFMLLP
jgi:hypothetical protein